MLHSNSSNSDLVSALTSILHKDRVTMISKFFTSVCMATSFLSVSLSLSDFLSDGFGIKKQGVLGNLLVISATFIPPIVLVLFYPDAFLLGLEFAGISVFVLMIMLPALMAWVGRYRKEFNRDNYQMPANKMVLALLVLFAAVMLVISGRWGILALTFIVITLAAGFVFEIAAPAKSAGSQ